MKFLPAFVSLSVLAAACSTESDPATTSASATPQRVEAPKPVDPEPTPGPARSVLDHTEHTSAPLRAELRLRLNAPPDRVWALISDHDAMPTYFPGVSDVQVDNSKANSPDGVGAVRSCNFGGMPVTEDIRVWLPNRALGYSLRDDNAMGLRDHLAIVSLDADGPDGTVLRWRQYFDHAELDKIQPQVDGLLGQLGETLTEKFGGKIL